MSKNKAPDRLKRSILQQEISHLGFGMIDFKDVVNSIRLKTILRLLNDRDSPLHDIVTNSVTNSVTNIKIILMVKSDTRTQTFCLPYFKKFEYN